MEIVVGEKRIVKAKVDEAGRPIVNVPPDPSQLLDYLAEKKLSDGLPVIPPTRDRVQEMVKHGDREGGEVICKLPTMWAELTVEKLAINAVMAGCRPEYFPVVLAAAESVAAWPNLEACLATTSGYYPAFIINGPIRQKIEVNSDVGCIGPGYRANATIGRALCLALLTVGGCYPGQGTMVTIGHPGRYTFCFGENEEASPWEPLHVERGFPREKSTVTSLSAYSPYPVMEPGQTADGVLDVLARGLAVPGTVSSYRPGEALLILSPEHAKRLAKAGIDKEGVKQYLYEHARLPDGRSVLRDARDAIIVVSGGQAGNLSAIVQTFTGTGNYAVTREI